MPAHSSPIRPLASRACRPWLPLAAIVYMALAAACTAVGPERAPPVPEDPRAMAAAAYERGDYPTAAMAWERAARQAPADEAQGIRVSAADAWALAGDGAAAERVLSEISKTDLSAADRSRLDLVLADLALRSLRPGEADALLQQAAKDLPASAQNRYRSLQSQTRLILSGPMSMGLARAAQIGSGMRFYDPSQSVELMRALETVSSGELAIRADNPRADRQFVGWLDLALVIRQNLVVPDGVSTAVAAWKSRYPYHLLDQSDALDTWLRYRQLFSPPRRTAVLLPDTESLKGASDAIRDGLLSAYLERPGGGEVLFFASGDDNPSIIAAYFSALDVGASQIIGPLRRESVESLLNMPGLATPVLALNDLPAAFVPPPGLGGQISGLSLSQEAEVAAIAAHATASGYQRAIVVAPESAWGERLAAAFQAEFLQDDRQIIAATRYVESENDHSALLERLLLIDESKARAQRLENVLQMQLEFEPTRREDVDVIFMAASPTQAKLLRPQLRFLDAGDIPLYATSRIYSGQPNPASNQDLDGVRFPTTPWELAHASENEIPELGSLRNGSLASLFALGQDAWNILKWLELMHKDPQFVFPGASGNFRMSANGRLQRTPAWAEFSMGRPIPLSDPLPAVQQMTVSSAPTRSRVTRTPIYGAE